MLAVMSVVMLFWPRVLVINREINCRSGKTHYFMFENGVCVFLMRDVTKQRSHKPRLRYIYILIRWGRWGVGHGPTHVRVGPSTIYGNIDTVLY